MKITQALLDTISEQAKASPRLRMNYDLRNSSEDESQMRLNAIELITVLLESKDGAWELLSEADILNL